jgi:ELWxxDGT repeat protein
MVKDITPGPASTVISNFVEHKGLLYFFANGGISGEKLWRSDGTASGTYLVKDVNSPNFSLTELISDGQFLYFFPFTNQYGSEIWKSDGTAEGTVLLKNIAPGNQSSNGFSLFRFKNKIHFFAKPNGFDAPELWTTDGTTEGTIKVTQLTNSSNSIDKSVIAVNDNVFYFTLRSGFSDELWISDGTVGNTKIVKNLGQIVANMVILPDNLALFSLKSGNNVDDVWVSDGTNSGTKVLIDLNPIIKRTPFSIIRFREHAYILANDKDHCLLIKSDGRVSGSSIIARFISSSGLQNESLIPFKEVFFILAFKESNTKIEMFSSIGDETSIAPIIVNNDFNGRSPIPSDFRQLASSDIIFKADDMLAGRELFLYKQKLPLSTFFKINKGISCFGEANGELESVAFGGQPPYAYKWSTGGQEKTINNLAAGTYIITVTDASGNSFISDFRLDQPQPLQLNSSLFPETEYQKDGSVNISISGGTSPYFFLWNTGDSNDTLKGLSAGTYTVTVTDTNNCTIAGSMVVKRESKVPLSGEIRINKEIFCFGESTGELEAVPQGGLSPYIYTWSNGENTKIITNIKAGNYIVTLTDSLGNNFVAQIILGQPSAIISDITTSPETGYDKNGQAEIRAMGGTSPYTYLWNTNDMTNIISGLTSGNYTVTITDKNNCIQVRSVDVKRESKFPLTGEIKINKDIICFGESTGELEVFAQGGISPYTYDWSDGSTEKIIKNIKAGNYFVSIKDSLENIFTTQIILSQPSEISVEFMTSPEVAYKKNGKTETKVIGGTPPYTYLWNTGDSSPNLQFLYAGTYTVTITDQNNCVVSSSTTIQRISEFPLSLDVNIIQNIKCYGDQTGVIEARPFGGLPPYLYQWSNGAEVYKIEQLPSGTYKITVTDSLSQTSVKELFLNQPDSLTISIQSFPETGNQINGSIEAEVVGGIPPYTFLWNTMDTGNQLNNMASGMYSVTVTDSNNCKATGSGVIEKLSASEEILPCSFYNFNATNNILVIHECQGSFSYKIFDISSKEIFSGSSLTNKISDVSFLAKGVYFITFYNKNNKEVFAGKIIVL